MTYSQIYPLAPMGGAFVAIMGAFVLLGSAVPKARMSLVYLGLGAATLALIFSGRLAAGVPPPTKFLDHASRLRAVHCNCWNAVRRQCCGRLALVALPN